jgi:response regulator of citrate/malate metabolism
MKILIIDDSKIDAFLAQTLISKYNKDFDIEIECDPIKGKNKILQKNEINLIVLDLNMPKFDGIKILKFMNKQN